MRRLVEQRLRRDLRGLRALLVPAIAVVALAAGGSAGASGSGPVSGAGLLHLGGTLREASNQSRYSLVIVTAQDAAGAAQVPGRSLVYFAGTDIATQWNTGVSYRRARANGWLLKDASGNLLVNKGYGYYIGDVGNRAYQQAWIKNVLTVLHQHRGLDGVEIDDVLYDLLPMTEVAAAKYPTQKAWAAAQLSFVTAAGAALRAHGYYVLVNASGYIPGDDAASNDGTNTINWWRQLGPHVSGLMNEFYEETSDGSETLRSSGPNWNQNWDGWQRLIQAAQSMGKDFVGVAYGPEGDDQRLTYGKASFLLDWNGGGGAYVFNPTDNSNPMDTNWKISIGKPAAPKQPVGNGWLRKYTDGIAIVNPDPSNPQTFDLGGSYVTADGSTTSQVTVPPVSGLILRAAASTTAARRH